MIMFSPSNVKKSLYELHLLVLCNFFQTHVSYFKIILASKINSANLYYYVQLCNHP